MPNQNTNQHNWLAADEEQDTLFSADVLRAGQAQPENELAGVNVEALREAVSVAHNGLFGGEVSSAAAVEPFAEAAAEVAALAEADEAVMFAAAETAGETTVIPVSKVKILQQLLQTVQEASRQAGELLGGQLQEDDACAFLRTARAAMPEPIDAGGGTVVEGVFNGHCMIGPDGKQYNMPANYASKSKLVEGDILKLTISPTGKFIYKQIGPIERSRVVGTLVAVAGSECFVEKDGVKWKVLNASVTYFKGSHGDEAVVLVPKHGESSWAAVENIINK